MREREREGKVKKIEKMIDRGINITRVNPELYPDKGRKEGRKFGKKGGGGETNTCPQIFLSI